MKKLKHYFKVSLYSIIQNKGYAVFCILGTALTFIFVTFLIHLQITFNGDYPPTVNSSRTVTLSHFTDANGKNLAPMSLTEYKLLLEQIKNYESYSISNQFDDILNVEMNGNFFTSILAYANGEFWNMYSFKFISGRPFTEEECTNRKKCAVISKNLSKTRFHTTNSTGKKIEIRGEEFEIIGVVDNVPLFISPTTAAEIWTPYVFNTKEIPYKLNILFPAQTNMRKAKETIAKTVKQFYETKNIKVDISEYTLKTEKEGGTIDFMGVNLGVLIFIFILIPAMNIITLNMASAGGRAEEIAVRRTFGASRLSVFSLVLFENLLLAITGSVIGILLASPCMSFIQRSLFNELPMLNSSTIMPGVDIVIVIKIIIPLIILFVFLFGGLPAWLTAKRDIADVLKGGMK
jgi:ABC-type antimicrobial peptide transport system permease subunit